MEYVKLCCCVLATLILAVNASHHSSITLNNGGYDGIVISIAETVNHEDCNDILKYLEMSLSDASSYLYEALGGRAYLRRITVLLPSSWNDSCGRSVRSAGGELASRADIRITPPHLLFSDSPWTQQSGGCGQPGDFISLAYTRLVNPQHREQLGRALIREWAKFRYGVFDEAGVPGDPVYPACYHDEQDGEMRVSGCSNVKLDTVGLCENVTQLLLAGDSDALAKVMVHPEATSSIMFAHTAPQVKKFCDSSNHNRYAPTKHNAMCDRRSVSEVIFQHPDFANSISHEDMSGRHTVDTTPMITYKRETLTRYVLVIEDTNDMMIRESWSFLRLAIRKFAMVDLPTGSELGVVVANSTNASRLHFPVPLTSETDDAVAATVPLTPGVELTTSQPAKQEASANLPSGVEEALKMLEELNSSGRTAAASVILVIAPGTGRLGELLSLSERARRMGTRIATINYPRLARATHSSLDALAHATGGPAFTVLEKRQNQLNSYLNTYFELTQALLAIRDQFHQGDRSKLPVEIHRREVTDTGPVKGTFYLSEGLGEPSQFSVFVHNPSNPLVRSLSLISPSKRTYSSRLEKLLAFKMLTLQASINESGTWSYVIDRFPGNPQPFIIVVSATPRSAKQIDAPVTSRAWTSVASQRLDAHSGPLALYVEVKQGDWPVLGAKVEVVVSKVTNESTQTTRGEKFELFDTGSGDPDVTRGDGIYSRYYTGYSSTGPGLYLFHVQVTDNGNTAYTWQTSSDVTNDYTSSNSASGRCCGSAIWPRAVRTLSPFDQVLAPLSIEVGVDALELASRLPPGHVADLTVQPVSVGELRARLTWTAPGDHGDQGTVARYDVRYSEYLKTLIDDFESARPWEHGSPYPLAAGAETTFSLDMTDTPELLDKPLFVALRAYDYSETASRISNVVRVMVPSPPRTPLPPDLALPERNGEFPEPAVVPRLAAANSPGMILQVVLPVAAGVVVLAVCLGLYCVMVVHRRKRSAKESNNTSTNSLPPAPQPPAPYSGPPPNYEAEEKKLYCTLPAAAPLPCNNSDIPQQISIISGGRTLSPYQSWTASQLLHEHERRHSPYGYITHQYDGDQGPPIPPPPNNNAVYAANYHNTSFLSLADESSIYGQRSSKVPPPTLPKPIMVPFNPSLQGSLSSVNSDKKKRNVTMV